MKASSGQVFICHGFNNYFEPPKLIGEHQVMFRTAIVIKKRDSYDEWYVYDDLFWRMMGAIVAKVADSYRIKVIDQTAPTFDSASELREWQSLQKATDSEFVLDPPGEIDLFSADAPICHIELEDWSDIVEHEPYACSFTFSFYSDSKNVNAEIDEALRRFLSTDKEVSEVTTVNEYPAPKWYWPLLRVVKGDSFLLYTGVGVLAIFAIVMVAGSPSPATEKKILQCRRFLHKARMVLLSTEGTNQYTSFEEWRATQDVPPTNMPLAVQICDFFKEYSARAGTKPFRTLEVEGGARLVDPWGRPYNVDMLSNIPDERIRQALAGFTANGMIMWSSGKNGVNEHGSGDDIFENKIK